MTVTTTRRTTTYLAPKTLEALLRITADAHATVLAGGTDLIPRWKKDDTAVPTTVVDVKRIAQLKGVTIADGVVHVGACTLMSELAEAPVIRREAPVLAEAAGRVACAQIRNRATIGGNLANASPAADTAVPLLLLDAVAVIATHGPAGVGSREVALTDFFKGPGKTALNAGEILTAIRFTSSAGAGYWAWDKLGTRPAMEIAVAGVGVLLRRKGGIITHARIGYGSVAPVPMRGSAAEAVLVGHSLDDETVARCVAAAREEITPISDVRASAGYRRAIVGTFLRRMLLDARSC
ncbi:MAG: FAD binding domain-containing protein [Phycisphaerae bacterium]